MTKKIDFSSVNNEECIDALKQISDIENENISKLPDIPDEESLECKQNIQKMIDSLNKEQKMSRRRLVPVYSVIIFFAVICILLGCSPTAKAFVSDIIVKIKEGRVDFINGNVQGKELTEIYEPTWLPDGFELKEQYKNNTFIQKIYISNDKKLTFKQSVGNSVFAIEKNNYHIIEHNGNSVFIKKAETGTCIQWALSDYIFSIIINDSLDDGDIIKIIDSLEVVK